MVKMAELATVCDGLGLTGVRTILQSGNLVFRGERAGMAKRLRQAIAERFDLVSDALFHTGVSEAVWDESAARWRVRTDRGDEITCRYYVLAVGILNAHEP